MSTDQHPPDAARPGSPGSTRAERLVARAGATDRGARFELRLARVREARDRRRRLRHLARVGWVVVLAGAGALVPLVVAAATTSADPGGGALVLGAAVGAALGGAGPTLRERLARRRGSVAWDAYHERHVLLGDPSAQVRDADRPPGTSGGPPPPGT